MLRIFQDDYGYGYRPEWHWDYDDLQGVYLDNPRHTLLLALEDDTGELIGMGGVRSGGPTADTLPVWLRERYQPPERTAQIVRVFVAAGQRRRGVARRLVDALRAFVREAGGYERVCLHTEQAVAFWQAMGCRVVYDGRTGTPPAGSVHFELDAD
ncbi:MAG: GNAT family N-acetyltransferase [Chloroflexi bacterium]|nr:GNAT family N-acetyltransferase [Chloroflexota bacterium]